MGDKFVTLVMFVIMALVVVALWSYCTRSPPPMFDCTFQRMEGTYSATEFQINGRGPLIIVSKGVHRYAFPRSGVKSCHEVKND